MNINLAWCTLNISDLQENRSDVPLKMTFAILNLYYRWCAPLNSIMCVALTYMEQKSYLWFFLASVVINSIDHHNFAMDISSRQPLYSNRLFSNEMHLHEACALMQIQHIRISGLQLDKLSQFFFYFGHETVHINKGVFLQHMTICKHWQLYWQHNGIFYEQGANIIQILRILTHNPGWMQTLQLPNAGTAGKKWPPAWMNKLISLWYQCKFYILQSSGIVLHHNLD